MLDATRPRPLACSHRTQVIGVDRSTSTRSQSPRVPELPPRRGSVERSGKGVVGTLTRGLFVAPLVVEAQPSVETLPRNS